MKRTKTSSPEYHFEKAIKYFQNAKEILKESEISDEYYLDEKVVRKASGLGYLAVLEALKGYFLQCGHPKKKLPKRIEGFEALLDKYSQMDGKLIRAFENYYQGLHIACYYGGATQVDVVKGSFNSAKFIIERVTQKCI